MQLITFGSICSGIEAATVAWQPLWYSEIDAFPSALLQHHYPETPNLGDMCDIPAKILSGDIPAPDVVCGGCPCQSFSIAGKRESLNDHRGNLTLTFVDIINATDTARINAGLEPTIMFYENVPGILNTKDNAFGCFLAAIAGESEPLQPSGRKWANAGVVVGHQRRIAWRTLDAQYFGLAQRRKRVYVVASARNINPAEVLFEFDGVQRHTAPSRDTRQAVTADAGNSTACGSNGITPSVYNKQRISEYSTTDIASTCAARDYKDATDLVVHGASAIAIQATVIGRKPENGPRGNGYGEEISFTLTDADRHAVAYSFDSLSSNSMKSSNPHSGCNAINLSKALDTSCLNPACNQGGVAVAYHHAVRRLTVKECERLQGFPDDYTAIPYRNNAADKCPDAPRYKAIGNSWAVPVISWIGSRLLTQLRNS